MRGLPSQNGRNRGKSASFFSPKRAMSTKVSSSGQYRQKAQQQDLVTRLPWPERSCHPLSYEFETLGGPVRVLPKYSVGRCDPAGAQ